MNLLDRFRNDVHPVLVGGELVHLLVAYAAEAYVVGVLHGGAPEDPRFLAGLDEVTTVSSASSSFARPAWATGCISRF